MTLDQLIDYLYRYRSVHPEHANLPVYNDDRVPEFNRRVFNAELDCFERLEVGQVTNTTVIPLTYFPCLRLRQRGTIE